MLLKNVTNQTFVYLQTYRRIAMINLDELQHGSYLMGHFLVYLIIGNILNMQYKIT